MTRAELEQIAQLIATIKTDDRLIFATLALLIAAPVVAFAAVVTL